MLVLNTGRIGIWSVGFVEGRITEELREKHPEQGREPTATYMYGTGPESNPGHIIPAPLRFPFHFHLRTEKLRI